MFPTLPTEDILVIIDSAPPSATTQYLVERCLERQDQLLPPTASSSSSPSLSSSSSAAAPSSSPPLPYIAFEMTSLLPAHSDSSTPPFPVPSAPPIPPTHSPLLSAMSSLHSSLLSSPIPPPTLLSHLHSLSHVLTNPLHHPSVPKYRTLPLSNAKFHEKVLSLPAAKAVILACGWQEVEGGDMLLLTDDLYEPALLEEGRRLLEEEVAFVTAMLPPQQGSAIGGREGGGGGTDVMTVDTIVDHPLYQSKRTWREESKAGRTQRAPPLRTATPRLSRDQLAAIAEHRVHPKSTPPPSLPPGAASREVRRGRQMRLEDVRRRRAEVEAMRRDKKEEWMSTRQGRKRVITVDDLERMRLEELEQRARFGTGMSDELLVEIGKEAMRLTNEFRKEQGERSEVVWHAAMADIGWKHSKVNTHTRTCTHSCASTSHLLYQHPLTQPFALCAVCCGYVCAEHG